MPPSHRKTPLQAKRPSMTLTCPSCGRKGNVAKTNGRVRCSECGKEFKAGEGGIGLTMLSIVLALVVIAVIVYFAVSRASRVNAEEKVKAANAEQIRQAAEQGK